MCFHMLNLCWVKHKKIFECFKCFWKVFCSLKLKDFKNDFCPILATQSRVSPVACHSRELASQFWRLVHEWKVQSRGSLRDFRGSARDSLNHLPPKHSVLPFPISIVAYFQLKIFKSQVWVFSFALISSWFCVFSLWFFAYVCDLEMGLCFGFCSLFMLSLRMLLLEFDLILVVSLLLFILCLAKWFFYFIWTLSCWVVSNCSFWGCEFYCAKYACSIV